jgi:nitrogen fixation protein FixH
MNWGYKISIVFAGFVILIITLVVISMRQKDIHLVTERYYEKEIAYQDQIDIEKNTAALDQKPKIEYQKGDQIIAFTYPDHFYQENVKGKILFYRPSDAGKDFTVPVNSGIEGTQKISIGHLEKGFWRIKMEWVADSEKYYIEEKLVIQ